MSSSTDIRIWHKVCSVKYVQKDPVAGCGNTMVSAGYLIDRIGSDILSAYGKMS